MTDLPSRDLPKTFDPAAIEARWYTHWETNGLFRPDRPGAEPWTIVNPPPNVTGSLHIGHALDNTLQDILTRHARLKGKDALWVVGTDHAGIATQMVVERRMAIHQQKRTDFTRDEFVAKVWEWKAESGGAITRQLRRLGCSMDWANERFTMDPGFSKAVLKVFVDLYNEGLLYRDKRLVNWDPGLGTAISDLEVETREVKGSFWHIRYPLADGSGAITVATTRPETMLADMAVAVHPDDERYRDMIGKDVRLPITGRLIPVIADEHADPALGTGAVKITPGHDFNDFEVGKRAGMKAGEMLNMLDVKARVVQTAKGGIPDELIGLERDEARRQVVARLKEGGFLVPHVDKDGVEHDAEPRTIQTPYGDRSGVVIEPWLTDQWYVDAATLAKPAIEAVRSGAIRLVPKTWEKTFFNWMENIQPWCVSRQLWWGHRIPAWYGPNKSESRVGMTFGFETGRDDLTGLGAETFVALKKEDAIEQAARFYDRSPEDISIAKSAIEAVEAQIATGGSTIALYQDVDVLDTWFSSALWPFATLGWPENADPTLAGRYPNDVLVSGFDILFFWDARMMMQGMHFMGQSGERKPENSVPFRTLYLHGLVRAADGAKMSKSKGNTVDPLGLIDHYGADALRFFMAAMESQGRDIKMDEKRVEGYRNFATKLWNAARFCQANGIGGSASLEPPAATVAVNKWIVGQAIRTVQAVDLALADYRFDAAANAVYQFVWSRFCDWYLELIKGAIDDETRAVAGWVLDTILVLLHPFMPFITEELWHALAERDHDLIVAHWPMADARTLDAVAEAEVEWLIQIISELRAERLAVGFKPIDIVPIGVLDASAVEQEHLNRNLALIKRMARIRPIVVESPPAGLDGSWGCEALDQFRNSRAFEQTSFVTVQLHAAGLTFVGWTDGFIDLPAERARLAKAIAAAEKERDGLAARLNNASFVERAKPEAVEKARADHADKAAEAERLSAALARLG